MSLEAVARKDFQDASRSYLLWGLTAVFVLLVALAASAIGYFTQNPTSSQIIGLLHILFQYVVPLIAITIAFGAIVNERNSGSLKILLSLPHSREEVIAGKVVGRAGALLAPLVVGMLLPALGMLVMGVTIEPVKYVGYLVLTALFGVAYVAIATGVSASFDSRFRVLLVLFGFYFVFNVLWRAINTASFMIVLMVSGNWPGWMPLTLDETLQTFQLLTPTGDFHLLKRALFNDVLFATEVGQGLPGLKTQIAALVMLLLWIAIPVAFGMWRFEAADL